MPTTRSYRPEVGALLEILAEGIAPFVDRRMRDALDDDWIVTAATKLGKREPVLASPTDPQFQLEVIVRWWGPAFADELERPIRDTIQSLRTARNDWAHIDDSHPIDLEYARRIHVWAEELLAAVGSPLAEEVGGLGRDLERQAARAEARAAGVDESEILATELTRLHNERAALRAQLTAANEHVRAVTGRQRAAARQLAELQAQYAAVSGLRERYRELQTELEDRRTDPSSDEELSRIRTQLDDAIRSSADLQAQSEGLHAELRETQDRMREIDPIETELGRRYVMLVAALVMVLGVVIIMAVGLGTTM